MHFDVLVDRRCLHSMSLVVALVSLLLAHLALVRWLSSQCGGSLMSCGGSSSQCCAGAVVPPRGDASVVERERENDKVPKEEG